MIAIAYDIFFLEHIFMNLLSSLDISQLQFFIANELWSMKLTDNILCNIFSIWTSLTSVSAEE